MKCPKCGYLGFETSDRCRNCGYDFSLSIAPAAATELPLRSSEGAGSPLADFNLHDRDTSADAGAPELDLDRLIGDEDPADVISPAPSRRNTPTARADRTTERDIGPTAPGATRAPSPPGAASAPAASATRRKPAHELRRDSDLPLFGGGDDDAPLITQPRPARPPLSVRRTTPEIPRTRLRVVTPRPDDGEFPFPSEGVGEPQPAVPTDSTPQTSGLIPAAAGRRLLATLVDLVLLGSINAVVLYLTLALAGLTVDQVSVLPLLPIVTFFVMLDGGYLVTFIAAGGQTIGKMLTGVRVVGDDGQRVDMSGAVLRAVGCGASLLTAGLGYLPAFVTADRRALQDRISGTRVVSAR